MWGVATAYELIKSAAKLICKVTCSLKGKDMLALFVVGICGQRYIHVFRKCPR